PAAVKAAPAAVKAPAAAHAGVGRCHRQRAHQRGGGKRDHHLAQHEILLRRFPSQGNLDDSFWVAEPARWYTPLFGTTPTKSEYSGRHILLIGGISPTRSSLHQDEAAFMLARELDRKAHGEGKTVGVAAVSRLASARTTRRRLAGPHRALYKRAASSCSVFPLTRMKRWRSSAPSRSSSPMRPSAI